MLTLRATGKFRKDVKRAARRGKDLSVLRTVITTLLEEKTLAPKYKDHPSRHASSGDTTSPNRASPANSRT